MTEKPKISLVLADVDGTLVDENKVLTARAQQAVRSLHDAGIRFAITSGRPPRGMSMLFDPLRLTTPIAGFNGGLFVTRELKMLQARTLPDEVAAQAIDLIRAHGLDPWVYRGNDWLVTDAGAPHVAREADTVRFAPRVVADITGELSDVAKIVGVTDDRDRMQQCDSDAQAAFGTLVAASQSQPYYFDITHKDANKGAVVDYLSAHLNIPAAEIATIGDQPNDVLMFRRSGFSIAMGNASDPVKAAATATTARHDHEGFACAMERFILGVAA